MSGRILVSAIPNRLHYSVLFILYAQFTNMAEGRIIQRDGPGVGDPSPREILKSGNPDR
jgi:hypothetical protein